MLAERGDPPSLAAAVERLDIALSYNDANAAAWHDRGVMFTQLGEHDLALADYERAHQLAPVDLEFRFHLMEGHLNLHHTGKAPGHFEKARELFAAVSKVDVYKSEDFRSMLTAYKVLESILHAEDDEEE